MILRMLEEKMPVDEIIFCDTGKDFPDIIEHVKKVNNYIKTKYNKEITVLKSDNSFDYYMFDYVKKRGKTRWVRGYGWATMRCRWCTSILKNKVIDNYLKKYKQEGYTEYIGIAFDEPKRIKEKCYPKALKDYSGNILLVGINYDERTKEHSCKIEPYSL